jgi:hypothetical protein
VNSSPIKTAVMKSRRIIWQGMKHQRKQEYRALIEKPEGDHLENLNTGGG